MIVLIKYNAGNIESVRCALSRLGYDCVISEDKEVIKKADKVIFPGVGEASSAMKYLKEKGLDKLILSLKQPFLGICLGMQLMCASSEENNCECLGIFNQKVVKFDEDSEVKIPHVGWNTLFNLKSPLFKNLNKDSFCYFVHSYFVPLNQYTIATTNYAKIDFSAALNKDNFYGCQFHPEKSGSIGEKILSNFLKIGEDNESNSCN